jgi:hypothetical protein
MPLLATAAERIAGVRRASGWEAPREKGLDGLDRLEARNASG